MQYKSEIARAVEYQAELQAALLGGECGRLHKPISVLLVLFQKTLRGEKGVSVKFFLSRAESHLQNIKKYRKSGGQGVLPGVATRRPARRV
ncbi:hypothetical protein [Pseudodesulfovibrio pelocollis]|uniref:hypothetical protein n=1 Tax=Pseudodesulfovibrio pelocollis TaxID=3051432 RepID=UPI00255ACABE|nr:hypothetical protein [Pseudodesulfovibrio sp. SB368]